MLAIVPYKLYSRAQQIQGKRRGPGTLTWQIRKCQKKKKVQKDNPADCDGESNPYPQPVMSVAKVVQDCCAQLGRRVGRIRFLPSGCMTYSIMTDSDLRAEYGDLYMYTYIYS